MGVVIHLDKTGTGGSGQGWNGQVEFRADLPITLGTPAIGEIYLVEKKTTLLGFTTYQSGLYIRDFNNGNLNDWRRLNVKVNFTDSEFAIVNAVDTSKKSKFDLSLITASTTRTYTLPDKDGTVALLSDITGGNSDVAASKGFWIQNIITAATLTTDVNNWSPTGFDADTDLIRVDIDANNRAITGIVAPAVGVNRILAVKNLNAVGNDLRFENNSASSLAANRFLCRDNANKSIKPNEIALWFYDHIQQRWTPFNRIG